MFAKCSQSRLYIFLEKEEVSRMYPLLNHYDCLAEESCNMPKGYVQWSDVLEKEVYVGGQVSWAKVKSVQRSIEKSTRSYGKVCQY
jgi:hypothetical protein